MLNTERVTFRCMTNREGGALLVPEFQHDVVEMRRHPEYEELDAAGNVVARQEVQQEIKIVRVPVPAPAPAKKGRK